MNLAERLVVVKVLKKVAWKGGSTVALSGDNLAVESVDERVVQWVVSLVENLVENSAVKTVANLAEKKVVN